MYDNIGGKIKILAKVSFIVAAIAEVITGITIMAVNDDLVVYGLLVMIVGPIVAWVSSWVLYGFGEIIDKLSDIERNTRGGERKSEEQEKIDDEQAEIDDEQAEIDDEQAEIDDEQAEIDDERVRKIEKLRSQGLITEEEYQKAISKTC